MLSNMRIHILEHIKTRGVPRYHSFNVIIFQPQMANSCSFFPGLLRGLPGHRPRGGPGPADPGRRGGGLRQKRGGGHRARGLLHARGPHLLRPWDRI